MPLEPGSRLGPYEILAPLGAGGMGEVYRAHDPRLGRDVAIKVIAEAAGTDPERLGRFEQEARAVAALSHPNVLAIFDVGATPFLVTELLEGEPLRASVERGPLPAPRTLDLARQLAAGLAAAHARGIVHRDLKPENVFVTADGHLKILDFGLAKQIGPASGVGPQSLTRAQTQRGMVLGTVGYMAPEQVRGHEADHRADIFAYGAILFEMLTGHRAFHGESPADTMSAILHAPASTLAFGSGTPLSLVRIIRRCLEKDAGERFQSARDLGFAIEAVSDIRTSTIESAASTEQSSIGVLPFADRSADGEHQYFCDGLAEDLIAALARLSGLRVASRTSSFRFRGRDVDVRQIGRELGVGAILEGSVRRAGNRLRITAQLTNALDGYHIWSGRYDREMADVFDIQDEIVDAIVSALAPTLVREARAEAETSHGQTENLEAYELYLKGRHFWNQRSPAVVGQAIQHFEKAIDRDPEYALAYAGLADCYSILRVYGWTPLEDTQPRALAAVTRALALEPALPEAKFSKALYTFHFEREWRHARRDFLEALAASPRTAMFEAYFAMFLAAEFSFPEARRHLDTAIALDPHSSVVHFLAASTTCLMSDFAAVERHVTRALELQPESLGARWPQTVALTMSGRLPEALAYGEQVIARTRAPIYLGVLGMIYGCAGRLDDARRLGQELSERQGRGEYIVPAARLSIYLGLRDLEGVRASLTACVEGGAAPFSVLATSRQLLETYRGEPTMDPLLDRLYDGARPASDARGGRLQPAGA